MMLDKSVVSANLALGLIAKDYKGGAADFNHVALIEQNLVQQQDLQAQAHGEIAQGLIQVYRALGGGWQVPPCEGVEVQATLQGIVVPADQPQVPPPAILEPPVAPLPPPPAAPASRMPPPAAPCGADAAGACGADATGACGADAGRTSGANAAHAEHLALAPALIRSAAPRWD